MAEGRPDWGAAIRAATPSRQPEAKSRKHPVRDGQHDHQHPDGNDGGHHHPDISQKMADHNARLNALEAHMDSIKAAHHMGKGDGSGPS